MFNLLQLVGVDRMVHRVGLKCFEAQTFEHSCFSNLLFTHNYSSPSVYEGLLEIIAGGLNYD